MKTRKPIFGLRCYKHKDYKGIKHPNRICPWCWFVFKQRKDPIYNWMPDIWLILSQFENGKVTLRAVCTQEKSAKNALKDVNREKREGTKGIIKNWFEKTRADHVYGEIMSW
jgi:hypothetical protein